MESQGPARRAYLAAQQPTRHVGDNLISTLKVRLTHGCLDTAIGHASGCLGCALVLGRIGSSRVAAAAQHRGSAWMLGTTERMPCGTGGAAVSWTRTLQSHVHAASQRAKQPAQSETGGDMLR